MNASQEILYVIKTLDPWAMGAWGAKNLVSMEDGLKFQTSGMTPWKGHVYVKYVYGKDLYEIQFYRIRKAEIKMDKVIEDVYAEDLVRLIDDFVG
jgi:hypothetical protein